MFRLPWRPRWRRGMLAIALSTLLLAIALVFWRASHAKQEATAEVLAKSDFPFRVLPVDRASAPGVDILPASPGFRDLAAYKEKLVVSARAGLFIYDRNGALTHTYRAGIELPPAELGSMSAGIGAGAAEPELFIATHGEGLLAFNGTRFSQIVPVDSDLRNITSVLVLGSGRILLGTERRGLLAFDGHRIASVHARLKASHITALAGTDGDLWIGTLAEGVFHFRAGQLEDLRSALPDPRVMSLSVADGAAYVGTPLGVVEFRNGKRTRRPSDGFFARAVNLEGQAYAVAESAVYRFEPALKRWQAVLSPGSVLLSNRTVAALELSRGRLWIGYFDHGLDVVDTSLKRSQHFWSDSLFCVNRIVADAHRARTAVATANGLVLFDASAQPRQVIGKKDGLLSDHVTGVVFRDGGMVVATPAGLSFIDHSGVRSLYVFRGLVNNHVYTVAARGAETRANYTTANLRLEHNWITAMARVGDEWFAGTYGAGVLRLDASGDWHSFPDLKNDFIVNPNAMIVTGANVYAGSLDRGLFVFDRISGSWANTTVGLPSKNVTALAAGDGYLYAGTDNGLARITEGAL